jgi:deoxyribodipyrimidine photolyase-related protein
MSALRLVLGDQLTRDVSALDGIDPARDVILMAEVHDETVYVPHHKQKIAFILSAMRHFAEELRAEGLTVDYVKLDDPANSGSLTGEVARALARRTADRVVVTEPGEWRVLEMMRQWGEALHVPVEIRDDDRFFCSRGRFARWAGARKSYRMEFFYREMRRETGLLMDGDDPVGGQWNFDHDNRKALPPSVTPPRHERFAPDAITRDVLALVAQRFSAHFGELDTFGWATTREGALEALRRFIAERLPLYGDYQDAMKQDEPFLFHATISPYLNCGLLTPREVCVAAELAFRKGQAPLNAVEGFIRQILGWREYCRGIYWLRMPDYAATNALDARRPLPWCYWSGETQMNCIAQVVNETRANAYAHHIQRLMITGNFALIASLDPAQVEEWYLAVYADAYEWVELPNTHGMSLFADGGLLASKPYAASGAYIDRMSDYCRGCAYDVRKKSGPGACPFNLLYWRFMIVNQERLANNPRMAMPYRTLAKMTPERRADIVQESEAFLHSLATGAEARASQPELDL